MWKWSKPNSTKPKGQSNKNTEITLKTTHRKKKHFKEPTRAAAIDGAIREIETQSRSFLFQVEKMKKKTYHLLLCTIIDTEVYMKILNIYIFKHVEA